MFNFFKRIIYPLFASFKFIMFKSNLKGNLDIELLHEEQACFILGSGNSLNTQDLTKLKDKNVITINNVFVKDDYNEIVCGSGGKYHICAPIHPPQTEDEWLAWLKDMDSKIPPHVKLIFGVSTSNMNIKRLVDNNQLFIGREIYWYFTGKKYNVRKPNLDGISVYNNVYSCEAASLYAIFYAMHMGFSKIYLMGMDHDYFLHDNESDMRIYSSAIHQKDEFKRTFGDDFYVEEFLRQYKIFKKYSFLNTTYPGRIVNLSSGKVLKIFQRNKFEDVV